MDMISWAIRNNWRCLGRDVTCTELYSINSECSVENDLWMHVRGDLGESADRKRVEARTIVLH